SSRAPAFTRPITGVILTRKGRRKTRPPRRPPPEKNLPPQKKAARNRRRLPRPRSRNRKSNLPNDKINLSGMPARERARTDLLSRLWRATRSFSAGESRAERRGPKGDASAAAVDARSQTRQDAADVF